MIPLFKAFSLVIRVLSRPMLNYTKRIHAQNSQENTRLRKFFIWVGNFYHRTQSQINRKVLRIQSQFAFKPLNDQLAIQKGIQFIYQIIFYSIVIGLPIYQMYTSSEQAMQKSLKNEQRLNKIETNIENVFKQIEQLNQKHSRKLQQYQKLLKQLLQKQESNKGNTRQEGSTIEKHFQTNKYCFPNIIIRSGQQDKSSCKIAEYRMCIL